MLDQLYREHHQPALRILTARIGADAAEDMLMTAWEILARRLQRHPDYVRAETIRGWLVLVALREHYTATRRYRETAASDRLEFLAVVDRSSGGIAAHLELAELLEAIEQLTPGQQRAQLAAMLGLSYRQECEATGATYTNVNRHRTEGRAHLRAQLA